MVKKILMFFGGLLVLIIAAAIILPIIFKEDIKAAIDIRVRRPGFLLRTAPEEERLDLHVELRSRQVAESFEVACAADALKAFLAAQPRGPEQLTLLSCSSS